MSLIIKFGFYVNPCNGVISPLNWNAILTQQLTYYYIVDFFKTIYRYDQSSSHSIVNLDHMHMIKDFYGIYISLNITNIMTFIMLELKKANRLVEASYVYIKHRT